MAVVLVGLATGSDARAQTRGSWNVDADGLWSGSSNWLNNTIAGGFGGTATFANNITATRTISLDTNRSLGSFIFGDADTSSAAGWIVSGSTMTMNNGTNSATITVNALGTGATATLLMTLGASGTTPSIIKDGPGTLVLGATNNFTTKLAITSGTLQVSTDRNLGGVGAFATDRITISNGATLRTSAAVTLSGSRGLTIGSGGGTISVNGGNLTIAAPLTGSGNTATVSGANAVVLQNTSGTASDVNWDFAANSGVRAFFEGGNALGTGSVRVRGGVRLVSQSMTTGTRTNSVTLDTNAGLTARSTGGAQTYTSVLLPSSGTVVFNKDDQTTTRLTIVSGGTLTGNLTIDTTQGGTNAVGRVTLSGVFAGSGGLTKSGTGASGALVLDGANTYTGTTSVTTGDLYVNGDQSLATGPVIVSASAGLGGSGTIGGLVSLASTATFKPGSFSVGTLTLSGSLSLGSGVNYNWQMMSGTGIAGAVDSWDLLALSGPLSIDSTSVDPFKINLATITGTAGTSGSAANFNPATSATWTIARAAGGITGFATDKFLITSSATNGTQGFVNDLAGGTFSLAQSGNDLNLVFTAGAPTVITIDVASGTQTQTQAGYPTLSGSIPVLKTGGGTLVLDQANPLTGSTTVQAGVLQLANGSALSASRLVVVAGGTGQVAPVTSTSVASLDLATGNGLLDLTTGAVTITSGMTGPQLVAEILEGRGDGSWTGTSGITSSTAAAQSAAGSPRAVGWIDNGDGSLTAAYAAPGDTNVDWAIDILDASNFLALGKFDTAEPATWVEGDFSYDGIVDILDAADFFATGLYDAGAYNTASGQTGGVAAVPEPALSVGLMLTALAAGTGLLRRRALRCVVLGGMALSATATLGEEAGFTNLFDGTTLAGWKASEHVESWTVVDGAIVCRGPRSHLFYVGADADKPADFTNFHLKAEVMTRPNANAGIFFHTAFQPEGWPEVGYEMQVNNSFAKDPVRTGSIYNFVKVFTPAARDDVWFTQELIVKGKRITVSIDEKVLFEVVEPDGVTGSRKLSHGTFALQAHDPGSEARFRNLRVKRLP